MEKCPICGSNVISGKRQCYETLEEHIWVPNKYEDQDPPLRDTFTCENKDCYISKYGYWSNEEKAFYFSINLTKEMIDQALKERPEGNLDLAPI